MKSTSAQSFVRHSTALILASIVALPACDASARGGSLTTVRDSAGIRIVENQDPGPGEERDDWQIEVEPAISLGLVDGPEEYQFHLVRGAVRLSDGRLAVLNAGTNELRLYDVEGRHLATAGRQGSGPGEFDAPAQLLRLPGDTLLVWDELRRTRSWFDSDGRFTSSQTVDTRQWQGILGSDVRIDVSALLPDASTLLHLRPLVMDASIGWDRPRVGFARASRDFARVNSVGWYRAHEHYNVGTRLKPLLRYVDFGRETRIAAGGNPVRLFIGGMEAGPDGYEIHVYGPDGKLGGLIRHGVPARPASEDEVDQARDLERLRYATSPRPAAWIAEQLRTLPVPETVPPHGELRVDAKGNLWVQEWKVVPSERRRYSIFDPDGRLVGAVTTPEGLRITDIGADYVLGVWRDASGVEFVRLHALRSEG